MQRISATSSGGVEGPVHDTLITLSPSNPSSSPSHLSSWADRLSSKRAYSEQLDP